MERKTICCLRKINNSTLNNIYGENSLPPVVNLEEKNEVVIGRADNVDVRVQSPLISRHHAILSKLEDNHWTIKDNKSLNGISINGKKIAANEATVLKDGDMIQVGVPPDKCEKPEVFVWKFCASLRVKCVSKRSNDLQPSSQEAYSVKRGKKRKEYSRVICSNKQIHNIIPSSELSKKLQEQEKLAEVKIKEQEIKLQQLKDLLTEKEKKEVKMARDLELKEKEMKTKMKEQQIALEETKKQIENELRQEFEEQLKEKEDALVLRLVEEQERLKEERLILEERLEKEIENRIGKHDQRLHAELQREKEKLDKVIEKKELEQRLLESELKQSKMAHSKQKEVMLKVKEDVLANFTELMETELQCAICNELFVFATSLNCSHSFCQLCIEQWMDCKKECPVCRAKITSHLRSLVLDSYINKMAEHLSDELKESRKVLIAERKVEADKRKAEKEAKRSSPSKRGRGRGRGRGQQRQRPVTNETVQATTSGVGTRSTRPIVVEDDNSSSSSSSSIELSDSESSDSSVDGTGAYYGGYGACFHCGRRGHWANGCPYF